MLLTVGTASAAINLDFSGPPNGGLCNATIGGNASCTGVPVGSLSVTGTASHDGTYLIDSGLINFNTANSTFTLSGSVDCDNAIAQNSPNPPCGAPIDVHQLLASETLVTGTGTFTQTAVTDGGSGRINVHFLDVDTKSADLLTLLGITGTLGWSLNANFTLIPSTNPDHPFMSTSTDIDNTSVPEPTSILLLGTVAFGVSRLLRKMQKAQ
jgi:hypothetical protein